MDDPTQQHERDTNPECSDGDTVSRVAEFLRASGMEDMMQRGGCEGFMLLMPRPADAKGWRCGYSIIMALQKKAKDNGAPGPKGVGPEP